MRKRYLVIGIISLFICMSFNSSFAFDKIEKYPIRPDNKPLYDNSLGVQSGRGEEVIAFHNGNITNVICLTCPICEVAIRITPDELTPYDGWLLIGARVYFWENVTHEGEIKIYDEGTNITPGNLKTSGYCNFSGIGWRRINLSNPVLLDTSKDIWISYRTNYPWACSDICLDTGSSVPGKGDWIKCPDEWYETRWIGYDCNWGLEAIVRSRKILYVGGSGSDNYSRIQDAIDNATDGDTIFVYDDSSPYKENIIVDKSLKVFGENRNTTTILCKKDTQALNVTSENVNISDFTIQAEENSINTITLNGNDIKFSNNILKNMTVFSQNYNGILISNNIFPGSFSMGRIIYLLNESNCIIEGNNISNCDFGITISDCQSCMIKFNTVYECDDDCISDIRGNFNVIYGNTVYDADKGIFVVGKNAIVEKNTIYKCNFGITIYSSYVLVTKNILYNNEILNLDLEGANYCNITYNNFLNQNLIISIFCINSFHTKWYHNYWCRPRLLPKIIFNVIMISTNSRIEFIIIPIPKLDLYSALIPNDI